HKGNEFTSSIKDVYYLSDAMASDLSAGDNWEYIYVKAYLGDKLIGTDSARINVKQSLYEMKPDNVTLTGRKRGSNNNVNQNEVRLHLEAIDPNSSAAIAPNSEREYKVVWTTAGKHGGLY